MTIGSRFTNRRGVARTLLTSIESDTFYFGQGIRTISRRTLANCTVVIGDADGILPTRLLVADVVAGVSQTVAQLCSRAINVVNTGDGPAAICLVVWIASKRSRWALALRIVIVGDADGMRPAFNLITGRSAAHNSLMTDTRL